METDWEQELAALLGELSAVQAELLDLLAEKHRVLARAAPPDLADVQARETEILRRLQACYDRRGELLKRAGDEGLPADSVRSLADALPAAGRAQLRPRVRDAAARSRLLRHQSLTHWLLAQRTLIHLSQMLEIIATGGRPQPTYGMGAPAATSGALVDRAV